MVKDNHNENFASRLHALFNELGVIDSEERIKLLQDVLPYVVPEFMRPWSNGVDIDAVMKAEVGVAVLMTYSENNERYVLLCQSGAHYFRNDEDEGMPERYTYPGGFANLMEREGSFYVNPQDGAENPEEAGVREVEEEIVDADGKPVIVVDPVRCKPLDHDIVENKFGKPIVICSMYYELEPNEVLALKQHIQKLNESEDYRASCAEHTKSGVSDLPEVHTARFVSVHDAVSQIPFLHTGQNEHVRRLMRHAAGTSSRLDVSESRFDN